MQSKTYIYPGPVCHWFLLCERGIPPMSPLVGVVSFLLLVFLEVIFLTTQTNIEISNESVWYSRILSHWTYETRRDTHRLFWNHLCIRSILPTPFRQNKLINWLQYLFSKLSDWVVRSISHAQMGKMTSSQSRLRMAASYPYFLVRCQLAISLFLWYSWYHHFYSSIRNMDISIMTDIPYIRIRKSKIQFNRINRRNKTR